MSTNTVHFSMLGDNAPFLTIVCVGVVRPTEGTEASTMEVGVASASSTPSRGLVHSGRTSRRRPHVPSGSKLRRWGVGGGGREEEGGREGGVE